MRFIDSLAANATTSLQRDIAGGKPSELDFWNGSVVRQGWALNVSTPVSQFIYHTIFAFHRGGASYPA
jgi:2-dehydropantoate 2-reductase